MRRLAWNALTLLSALLALVAAVIWPLTCFADVRLAYTVIDRSAEPRETATTLAAGTAPHRVQLALTRVRLDRVRRSLVTLDSYIPAGLTWQQDSPSFADVAAPRRLLPAARVAPVVQTGFGDRSSTAVDVPLWVPLLAGTLLPAGRLRRGWASRRRAAATCRGCGYDLRASPARCPECGAAVTPPPLPAVP